MLHESIDAIYLVCLRGCKAPPLRCADVRTQIQEALLQCQVAQQMRLLLDRRVQQGLIAQAAATKVMHQMVGTERTQAWAYFVAGTYWRKTCQQPPGAMNASI